MGDHKPPDRAHQRIRTNSPLAFAIVVPYFLVVGAIIALPIGAAFGAAMAVEQVVPTTYVTVYEECYDEHNRTTCLPVEPYEDKRTPGGVDVWAAIGAFVVTAAIIWPRVFADEHADFRRRLTEVFFPFGDS